jgi:hypothetical protein
MAPLHTFAGHAPAVHETAFIAPTASIIGNASLAQDSSAFYGVSVRADTAAIMVGPGSNLQDNVVLHADPGFPCTVGAGVSVGHGAVVHGCTVEDDCLIGMRRGPGGDCCAAPLAGGRCPGQGAARTHRRGVRGRETERRALRGTVPRSPRPARLGYSDLR